MNKLKLTLDTDTINMEDEIHNNNFFQKIKNLSQHCVNFIIGLEDETYCSSKRFLREYHDDDSESTIESCYINKFIRKKNEIQFNINKSKFPPFVNS